MTLSALPFFKRTLEIDPKFAIAYAYLGRIYGDIGESELSAENTTKAYQLRDRASDAEKFFITATYDQQVMGNLEKAQETFELWGQTYPREDEPPGLLSGTIYPFFGKYEKAIEQGKRAIALDPDVPFGYVTLATAYQFVDRLEEAEATLSPNVRAQTGDPGASGRELRSRLSERRQGGNGTGGRSESRKVRRGRLGGRSPRLRPGIRRPYAAGQEHVATRSGPGPAGGPAGDGGSVRNRSRGVGRLLREYSGGKAEARRQYWNFLKSRDVEYGAALRWRSRAILPSLKRSPMIWQTLPRGYGGQIQLPAGASRTARVEP